MDQSGYLFMIGERTKKIFLMNVHPRDQ